ncbi:winged helix-turn-helix domain-containing protein [Streptomyces sp. WMMB 322]|uniref:winged helix-turn-helix domain-containing protein n=1 Tax=Streptomyces sp. WMMB 322 TaxID=1286821 RepID=UPI0006E45E23|nr:winged helix-turn-helix domain-containing protein [Streptomyces sp. WMMB 322]SCK05300.1 transcriptional regulator, GntR family [Streptomyces sp. WMMB 322]
MNRTSPAKGARSPHEAVAAALRERIDSGELPPEARIPTQKDLAEEFGVNRAAVRQAVQDLKRQGLLTDPGRGAPPTVARPGPSQEEPKPAGTELAERLYEAFRAEHVTIDTYSLTTETLNNALARPHRSIVDGTIFPRSIKVRAIVPSPQADLALPRLVDDPDDRRPLDRLHEIQRTWATALRNTFGTFRGRYEVPEVSCEIRTVAATPLHKIYILNGTEALMGYYTVVRDRVPYRDEELEIFDVLGLESPLFRFSAGPDGHDKQDDAFLAHSQAWFDSLWENLSTPQMPD